MPFRNLPVDLPAGFEADEFVLTAFDDVAAKVHLPVDPVAEFHREIEACFERAEQAQKLAG